MFRFFFVRFSCVPVSSDEPTDSDYSGNYDDYESTISDEALDTQPLTTQSETTTQQIPTDAAQSPIQSIAQSIAESSTETVTSIETTTPGNLAKIQIYCHLMAWIENLKKIIVSRCVSLLFSEQNEIKFPAGCKRLSAFDLVDCSNHNLTQIPKNLPLNTVELNLSHNLLTTLDISELTNYKELRQLFLNNNQIETIINTEVSVSAESAFVLIYLMKQKKKQQQQIRHELNCICFTGIRKVAQLTSH